MLAAGAGRRFDPSGRQNKLLAKIDGESVAVLAARHLLAAGLPVVAVVRPGENSPAIPLAEAGCEVIVCEDADLGMGHSLAYAIASVQRQYKPDGVVVALGDMPFVSPATITAVASQLSATRTIVAAATDGIRGHPVAFWHTHFGALCALRGDNGAGQLLKQYPVSLVDPGDSAVIRDIDQTEDLPWQAQDTKKQ